MTTGLWLMSTGNLKEAQEGAIPSPPPSFFSTMRLLKNGDVGRESRFMPSRFGMSWLLS